MTGTGSIHDVKNISWQVHGSCGLLTLSAPPGNLLADPEFVPSEILREVIASHQVKGLVITGAGRNFSAGADLEALMEQAGRPDLLAERMEKGKELLSFIGNLEIPVIAAIRGVCFGGGLEIALSCHIRICHENTLFAFPESNHGLMPGLDGIRRMAGQSAFFGTLRMALGGDMINAREALELKLADEVIKDGDVTEYALGLLDRLTRDRPLKVINYVMKALRNAETLTREEAMREETRMFCELAREEVLRRGNNEE